MMNVLTLFFHGTFIENVFIPIRAHQDGQNDILVVYSETNFDGMISTCDIFYNSVF